MSATKIQWAEHTWNPIAGCSLKSPGCKSCYAMSMASRLDAIESAYQVKRGIPGPHAHYIGLTEKVKGVPVWTGKIGVASDGIFLAPLRRKKPTDYFVNSMSDLFHPDVPDEVIDRVWAVMAFCPQHTFKILTKRPERMREYIFAQSYNLNILERAMDLHRNINNGKGWPQWIGTIALNKTPWPLPNVWLGVSVEDQARADERRQDFKATSAATKFVSYEPALEIVDWTGWEFVNQIISGGESGAKARFVKNDAYRGARDFCSKHQIAYFHKQNGEWIELEHHTDWDKWGYVSGRDDHRIAHSRSQDANFFRVGKKRAGRTLDGVEHNGVPS